ncbi:uncharacterized protein [Gossypium hirsutum]|uniref:Uncharacterized protein isoform X1 n=1 Tax=Gossypium hirsutum TaxID=3635 RepID=A0ABM2YPE0_GOSHI|nr:uncharacterized protein LOC121206145 isoform X1 [Gossypium hirsutum]
MRMPLLQMGSEHCCEESILIPVILPSNSKTPGQTLTKSLYYRMLRQTGSLFSKIKTLSFSQFSLAEAKVRRGARRPLPSSSTATAAETQKPLSFRPIQKPGYGRWQRAGDRCWWRLVALAEASGRWDKYG